MPTYTTTSTVNENRSLGGGQTRKAIAQRIDSGNPLIGNYVDSITFKYKNVSGYSGTIYWKHVDGSTEDSTTLGSAPVPSNPSDWTDITFNTTIEKTIAEGDSLAIYFDHATTTMNWATNNSNPASDSMLELQTGTWASVSGEDLVLTCTYDTPSGGSSGGSGSGSGSGGSGLPADAGNSTDGGYMFERPLKIWSRY